jgi:hypothetical protein
LNRRLPRGVEDLHIVKLALLKIYTVRKFHKQNPDYYLIYGPGSGLFHETGFGLGSECTPGFLITGFLKTTFWILNDVRYFLLQVKNMRLSKPHDILYIDQKLQFTYP